PPRRISAAARTARARIRPVSGRQLQIFYFSRPAGLRDSARRACVTPVRAGAHVAPNCGGIHTMSDANPTAVSVPNLDDIAAAAIDALVAIVRDPTSPKPLALRAATALLRYVHNERRRADARERERRK